MLLWLSTMIIKLEQRLINMLDTSHTRTSNESQNEKIYIYLSRPFEACNDSMINMNNCFHEGHEFYHSGCFVLFSTDIVLH